MKIQDPAAMYYDPKTGLLNVVNDADKIFVGLTLARKMVKEFAFLGNDQEGIAWDYDGFLFIAQDIGGIIRVKKTCVNEPLYPQFKLIMLRNRSPFLAC